MKIYLVRHGEAVPPEIDPEKPLSPKGREEVEEIARALGKNSFPLSTILHSDKLRAKQTAQIFGDHLASDAPLEEHSYLAPNDPIDDAVKRIEAEEEDFMIVGHLPFLSRLTSQLVTGNEGVEIVPFGPGTTVCLETSNGSWVIDWVFTHDQA